MAYVSPNGTDNDLAIEDIEGFAELAEPRQDRYLRSAYRTVRDLAPPPGEPATEEYKEAARDAELAVVEFEMTTQGGTIKSDSLSGVSSTSFAGSEAVREIVKRAMGRYFGRVTGAIG